MEAMVRNIHELQGDERLRKLGGGSASRLRFFAFTSALTLF
jgi:hypothetical protein